MCLGIRIPAVLLGNRRFENSAVVQGGLAVEPAVQPIPQKLARIVAKAVYLVPEPTAVRFYVKYCVE